MVVLAVVLYVVTVGHSYVSSVWLCCRCRCRMWRRHHLCRSQYMCELYRRLATHATEPHVSVIGSEGATITSLPALGSEGVGVASVPDITVTHLQLCAGSEAKVCVWFGYTGVDGVAGNTVCV